MDTPKLPWARTASYATVTVGTLRVTADYWGQAIGIVGVFHPTQKVIVELPWPEGLEAKDDDATLVAVESLLRKIFTWQEVSACAGLAALNGHGPWTLGAKVTIFEDSGGEHPKAMATIGRMAKRGFRLAGTGEWYNFEGVRVSEERPRLCAGCKAARVALPTGPYVRPYQEGDEARIEAERAAISAKQARAKKRRDLRERREQLARIISGDWHVVHAKEEVVKLQKAMETHQATLAAHATDVEKARKELAEIEEQIKAE